MNNILVPVDFSDFSFNAMDYAVELAKKTGSEIRLLHACEELESRYSGNKQLVEDYNRSISGKARRKLSAIRKKIWAESKVNCITSIVKGDVTKAILNAVHKYAVDVIVMGSLGNSGLRRKIIGSKVADIISKTSVPLIAVPGNFKIDGPFNILISVYEPGENFSVLQPVFDLAKKIEAKIELAIVTPNENDVGAMREDAHRLKLINEKIAQHFSVEQINSVHLTGENYEETLHAFGREKNIGLHVMITHKRSWIEGIINKSLTKRMAYLTHVPLMAIPGLEGKSAVKNITNIGFYKDLYEKLGFLFYAIAASDQTIKANERAAVKNVVETKLARLEESLDEYGSDSSLQIISVFDWLEEENRDAMESFNVFAGFIDETRPVLTRLFKQEILSACADIAKSVSGTNRSESALLKKLEELLDRA